MMMRIPGRVVLGVLTAALLGSPLWGCGGKGQQDTNGQEGTDQTANTAHPPTNINPPPASSGSGEAALHWDVPEGWVTEQPTSSMRNAQYRVPGPGGDAELVVFYFGPGEGGDAMSNAQRWASQFTKPDGSPIGDGLKTSTATVGDRQVLHVNVSGTYTNTMVSNEAHPDHELVGAIVEGPDANWFFKMTGPASTVDAQKDAFQKMIQSIR